MGSKKPINILIVDDRPEGLIALESILKKSDYRLIKANSGREALAHVLAHDFAVILMDVQMPDMDGFETTSLIKQRERSKNVPIIFLTANSQAEHHVSMGYSVGAVDFVLKPLDPHILKSKVAVFVDLYRKNVLLQEQAEFLRDVERRERLRTLHELESEGRRRYQNLADAIPQIVFRADKVGAVEYFNQFWIRYSGLALEESVGTLWQNVVHVKDIPVMQESWREGSRQQVGFECECRLRQSQSGLYRWHLLRVVPETDHVGALVSWIGVATDIQDQKLVQHELLLAKKLADSANETKSNFLANMSHEIRTPLGIILGFSELLIDSQTSVEEKTKAIGTIRRNGDQLSKIIDEILDLSKVEAGKMDVERSEVVVGDLLRGIKDFMNLPATEKGLELKFEIEGSIPSRINSNATRVQQILVNLIGNAIKFSPSGVVSVTASYRVAADDNTKSWLSMRVKDSGPGLSAAQIEGLFQPFTQVDTSMTRKHGGTGLGLAVSRRLARALGGDIVVNLRSPGTGCEFEVTVPAGDPSNLEAIPFLKTLKVSAPIQEEKIKAPASSLKGISVLLVEDSLDNQALVSRFLMMEGAVVELASNGLEGVDKAMAGKHDVVLMDIQMPILDGYGAITRLRKSGFEKPIIALTAHGMIEDRQRCIEVGSDSHLTKPVNRTALIERVQQFAQGNPREPFPHV